MNLEERKIQQSPVRETGARHRTHIEAAVDGAEVLANTPHTQSRAKDPDSLRGKLSSRSLVASSTIEDEIKSRS